MGAHPGPPTPVFISYATEDRRIATAACLSLEDTGIDCWIAPRDVNPGESWPAAVTSAIESSQVMVVVLSSAAMRSDDVVREITLAAQERVAILPYRVDEVPLAGAFKYYLNPQHWLDASSHPLSQQHLTDLERALRRSLGDGATRAQPREPVATLPPPPPGQRRSSERAAAWSTAGLVAAAAVLVGPLALLLSSPLHDRPQALPANRFADLAEARSRVAYYALERGVIWAVIGCAILVAWIWSSRSQRPLLPSAIGVAFPAAVAGLLGGAVYQGAKYASSPYLANPLLHRPEEFVIRAASYSIPGAVIGFAFAGRAGPLARSEGALVGAAAGLLAGWLTYLNLGLPRLFSLIHEAAVVGGALAIVAVLAARRRTSPAGPGGLRSAT